MPLASLGLGVACRWQTGSSSTPFLVLSPVAPHPRISSSSFADNPDSCQQHERHGLLAEGEARGPRPHHARHERSAQHRKSLPAAPSPIRRDARTAHQCASPCPAVPLQCIPLARGRPAHAADRTRPPSIAVCVQSHADYFYVWIFPVILTACNNVFIHAWSGAPGSGWAEGPNLGGFAFSESGAGKSNMYRYLEKQLKLFWACVDSDWSTNNFTIGAHRRTRRSHRRHPWLAPPTLSLPPPALAASSFTLLTASASFAFVRRGTPGLHVRPWRARTRHAGRSQTSHVHRQVQ